MHIIADIGGTKTRMAGSRDLESFTDPIIFDTPQEYEDALEHITEAARRIAGEDPIDTFVAGLPVLLAHDKRGIVDAKNLPLWNGMACADDVERALSTRVVLENDTALVGLGEVSHGAGGNAASVAYLTVSTGVNAVHIVDGVIDPSYLGVSVGRQYVTMEDPPATWEDMISGSAIEKKYSMHPKELGKEWAGWEDMARIVAFGVHNAIMYWSPSTVVLGGSMFNDIGISADRVRAHVEDIRSGIPDVPNIVHSSLGDVGGLWGGLARLKQLT